MLDINFGYQQLIFEQIKLATEQEALDLVFYYAQIDGDGGTHHARVVAAWYKPGQVCPDEQDAARRRANFLGSVCATVAQVL